MQARNPVPLVTLPQILAWLLISPLASCLEELVVVARVAQIELPVPEKLVLRVVLGKPLQCKVRDTVDTVQGLSTVVLDGHVLREAGVIFGHVWYGPGGGDAPEFLRDILVNHLRGDGWVRNVDGVVRNMHQDVNIVLATGLEGEFADEGPGGDDAHGGPFNAGPGAQDKSMAWEVLLPAGHLLSLGPQSRQSALWLVESVLIQAEPLAVLLETSLLHVVPVDAGIVNLANELFQFGFPGRQGLEPKAAFRVGVGVPVGAKSTKALPALVGNKTKLLISTKVWSGHVGRYARIGNNFGKRNGVLLVEVTGLYAVEMRVRVCDGWLDGQLVGYLDVPRFVKLFRDPFGIVDEGADAMVEGLEAIVGRAEVSISQRRNGAKGMQRTIHVVTSCLKDGGCIFLHAFTSDDGRDKEEGGGRREEGGGRRRRRWRRRKWSSRLEDQLGQLDDFSPWAAKLMGVVG
ncbi:hypothetical protein VM1G_11349 [Cytospora mali]|uniref:Uncharacterized protein n=1 Tax=Cytospora mali TaxID=578113 RepID=A0A194VLV4_CYTMA|nr:hypothetical protein VM1G_11349 [Valsa mali]